MEGIGDLIVEKERLKLQYVKEKLQFDKFQSMPHNLKNRIHIRIITFTMQHRLKQLDNRIEDIDRQIQDIHRQQSR